MKLLFKPLFVLLLFAYSLTLFAQNNAALYHISDEKIDIEFTILYTFADLVEVKDQLAEREIELTYQLLQFDKYGNLRQISATLKTNNGHEASFTSRELQSQDKPGFHFSAEEGHFVKAGKK